MAASEALRNQVSAKWQDSFNRLNRGAGGISGLMEFSKVRVGFNEAGRVQRRCNQPAHAPPRPGR